MNNCWNRSKGEKRGVIYFVSTERIKIHGNIPAVVIDSADIKTSNVRREKLTGGSSLKFDQLRKLS